MSFNISDPSIVIYLLHIHGYYYFYLKYYADLSWLCSVGTCIVNVLILDLHRPAFCQLKNYGRLFIVKPQENMPSVTRVFDWQCIVDVFSFLHVVSV